MKRALSLLLLASILLSALLFTACQAPAPTPGGGGGGLSDVTFLDHLDEYGDSLDFSHEQELVISFAEGYYYEVYGEEGSNEKLDTLVYTRNRLLESRFGVEISQKGQMRDTGGHAHYEYVQLAMNTGDVTFDAILLNAYQAGKLILSNGGNFLDFRSEVPYCRDSIKAGEEWWPTDVNTDSTVMGKQFVAVSDLSLSAVEACYTVIFNKNLAHTTNVARAIDPDKYTAESTLYDVVRGNDWTLETMKSVVKDYWRDNPATGLRGERDAADRFGLVAPIITDADAFAYALGYSYVENDGVSAPEVWAWDGSQYDAIVSLRELYYSRGTWTEPANSANGFDRAAFFAQEDRVLFQLNTLGTLKADVMHNMEQDFGVLPYPKRDRNQPKYLTGSHDSYSALALPFTALWNPERLRMTGALLEALSAETCNSVKKPYYDEIVTHHNVVDGDSAEMIDLIVGGRVYDLGVYHYNELILDVGDSKNGAFALFFRYLIQNKDKDIVQYWQSNAGALENQMNSLLSKYDSILMGA